ncbi:MAG: 7-cyano-7-deazaguanine synthase [Deltaproteobacteria bacterium]|nr:7-cyano-7-deazaguanine synthase [Deltaproteobacteria bacterium]
MVKKVKALILFSGGLDSILAAMLLKENGLEVTAITFVHPFASCEPAEEWAKKIGIKLVKKEVDDAYFRLIRQPKHGYGSNMNPCVDCKIYMMKRGQEYADKNGFDFIATGEVVGERPFSQVKSRLLQIEKEAGLPNRIVRPLSGKIMPETEAEEKGLIDREWMMDISGRGRDMQFKLAEKFKIKDFPTPSGGCLLTDPAYSIRLAELLDHKERLEWVDAEILKMGRHFRISEDKIVVGRREEENKKLEKIARKKNFTWMEVVDFVGPVTILLPYERKPGKDLIKKAASLTVKYSDAPDNKEIDVTIMSGRLESVIKAKAISDDKAASIMIK